MSRQKGSRAAYRRRIAAERPVRPDVSRCVGDHAEPVAPVEIALVPLGHDDLTDTHRGAEQRPLCAACIDKLIEEHPQTSFLFTSLEWLPASQ